MKFDIKALSLSDVKLIYSASIRDVRGYFVETYVKQDFASAGVMDEFVQDNQSLSAAAGTVRGLHFQINPFAQAKLIRVLRGKILDVAVDLRRFSPTFGKSLTVELGAADGKQLYIPVGFAHGFCTLEPNTEVFYKVSNIYSSAHDRGLNWADPTLGIQWPVERGNAVLSDKDKAHPMLNALPAYFE